MPTQKSKAQSAADRLPVPVEMIQRRIYLFRGQKVMLDFDLADLYQVTTGALNQAVKRNRDRFPEDFMFQLAADELENWRSQFVISNPAAKMSLRRAPYAFTQEGVAMLATVLKSNRAVQVSIQIVRAFVKLRELLATHKELAARIEKIESTQKRQGSIIDILAQEILRLKKPPKESEPPKQRFGFRIDDK